MLLCLSSMYILCLFFGPIYGITQGYDLWTIFYESVASSLVPLFSYVETVGWC